MKTYADILREDMTAQNKELKRKVRKLRKRLTELLDVHEFIDNEEQHQTKATVQVLNDTRLPRQREHPEIVP